MTVVLASLEFGSPRWMAVLYLLIVAIAVYAYGSRWRRRAAVEFTGTEMLARLGRKPRKLRLIPPAFVIIAAVLMAAAATSPAWVVADSARIVFLVDVSNSMTADDLPPSRLEATVDAVEQFIDAAPGDFSVGLLTFDRSVRKVVPPGASRDEIMAALQGVATAGGSATGEAIQRATDLLGSGGVIIAIADGASSDGPSPIETAADALRRKARVYTVAVGTPDGVAVIDGEEIEVPVASEELSGTAAAGGGESYTAISEDQMFSVFATIAANSDPVEDRTEFAGPMAGIAATLLALALLVASRWSLRLP
jgi:Ca-activated chloride channel family protein